jgi:hypothetical protein
MTMQQVRDDNATSVGNGTKCRMIGSIITIIMELTKEKLVAVEHQCKLYLMGKNLAGKVDSLNLN